MATDTTTNVVGSILIPSNSRYKDTPIFRTTASGKIVATVVDTTGAIIFEGSGRQALAWLTERDFEYVPRRGTGVGGYYQDVAGNHVAIRNVRDGGRTEFGLFEPPPEFLTPDRTWRVHQVTADEIAFMDILAVRYFGPGQESLWWVIAHANGLVDPERELSPGDSIVIPPRPLVDQFAGRGSNAAAG